MVIQARAGGAVTREGLDELETHLHHRIGGQVRDLRVMVRGNGLVLQGQAHTYYAKQMVQQAVMEASSIPIAANEIRVS